MASIRRLIFTNESAPDARIIRDHAELAEYIGHCKALGQSIVLTQGTFDLFHIGHANYLEAAKSHGDVLVVGVDSDEKVRARKGPNRPIVPEDERLQMPCFLRAVDIVTIKPHTTEKWSLIKLLAPDVLIATAETYSAEEVMQLETEIGVKVIVLPPMAETSTSARIRRIFLDFHKKVKTTLEAELPAFVELVMDKLSKD